MVLLFLFDGSPLTTLVVELFGGLMEVDLFGG